MEIRDQFTERFVQALHGKNNMPMSTVELSRRTGLSVRSLNLYKSGRQCPSALSAAKIAQALQVSLDWLMGISDEDAPIGTPPSVNKDSRANRARP